VNGSSALGRHRAAEIQWRVAQKTTIFCCTPRAFAPHAPWRLQGCASASCVDVTGTRSQALRARRAVCVHWPRPGSCCAPRPRTERRSQQQTGVEVREQGSVGTAAARGDDVGCGPGCERVGRHAGTRGSTASLVARVGMSGSRDDRHVGPRASYKGHVPNEQRQPTVVWAAPQPHPHTHTEGCRRARYRGGRKHRFYALHRTHPQSWREQQNMMLLYIQAARLIQYTAHTST
jgi:hypothetical protein